MVWWESGAAPITGPYSCIACQGGDRAATMKQPGREQGGAAEKHRSTARLIVGRAMKGAWRSSPRGAAEKHSEHRPTGCRARLPAPMKRPWRSPPRRGRGGTNARSLPGGASDRPGRCAQGPCSRLRCASAVTSRRVSARQAYSAGVPVWSNHRCTTSSRPIDNQASRAAAMWRSRSSSSRATLASEARALPIEYGSCARI
jgi:hypothetical protein